MSFIVITNQSQNLLVYHGSDFRLGVPLGIMCFLDAFWIEIPVNCNFNSYFSPIFNVQLVVISHMILVTSIWDVTQL